MSVTVSNLILGPGTLYRAPFGTAEPLDTGIGTAPGVGWVDLGATKDGVTLTINQDWTEMEVDQLVDIAGRRLKKRELTIATHLAESTLENLAVALNDAAGPVSGTGSKKLTPVGGNAGRVPDYAALIFDGQAPNGKRRRVIARRVLNVDKTAFAYKKDAETVFTVSFSAHYVSSSIAPFEITDEV